MKIAPDYLLLESAHKGNILPLTSVCNVRCLFCSHRQNPPDIDIYKIPPLSVRQLEDVLQFISPENKIIIGESVTRIVEGEPFTHPKIREILSKVRERFPKTEIQITTNGSLIDKETARFLAGLGSVEINLSLNSASPDIRRKLMNDESAEDAAASAVKLAEAGVPFHGSIVAMPFITGWDDLGHTVRYLSITGARTIRVFMPGFTGLAPDNLRFGRQMREELALFLNALAEELETPVTFEPPMVRDLTPEVRGIIPGSKAAASGLRKGDTILSVNGEECRSRVDAFHKIKSNGPALLDIARSGNPLSITIEKDPGEVSGVVMDYDISPELIDEINRVSLKYRRVALLCSKLGEPVLKAALGDDTGGGRDGNFIIVPVENRFFGGSIMAAGLLTVPDFIAAVRESEIPPGKETALFLPAVAFDHSGRDLAGNSYMEIAEVTGKKVEII